MIKHPNYCAICRGYFISQNDRHEKSFLHMKNLSSKFYCKTCEVWVTHKATHLNSRYHRSKVKERGVKRKLDENLEDLI